VSQVVPVTGNRRYRLSAMIRTEDITSASGPRLQVRAGRFCTTMGSVGGPEVLGTRGWSSIAVEFVTPPDCRTVVVSIYREARQRLNSDLRGALYVDDVELEDRGPAT